MTMRRKKVKGKKNERDEQTCMTENDTVVNGGRVRPLTCLTSGFSKRGAFTVVLSVCTRIFVCLSLLASLFMTAYSLAPCFAGNRRMHDNRHEKIF